MKRLLVVMLSASAMVLGGCGLNDYNSRLDETLRMKKREQELDQNLHKAAQGKFQEYSVYLRVPKPLTEVAPPWTLPPGSFDHAASFQGSPPPPPAKEGAAPLPPPPPLKVHVLVRNKPKKATSKKGEAPNPAVANRGDFVADVRQLLTAFGTEGAEKAAKSEKRGATSYQSIIFKDTNTGNDIRVYFAGTKDSDSQVAMIFDIPKPLLTMPIVTKGVDFTVESFVMGAAARALFNGPGPAGPGGKAAAGGPAF